MISAQSVEQLSSDLRSALGMRRRPTPRTSNSMRGIGGAKHRQALTNPLDHSALEHPYVGKARPAQNLRRTGGALLRVSDGNEKPRTKGREVVETIREILDGNVDGTFQATERTSELLRRSHVEHRRRFGLRQALV